MCVFCFIEDNRLLRPPLEAAMCNAVHAVCCAVLYLSSHHTFLCSVYFIHPPLDSAMHC